jgi:hypothetical protein
MEPMKVDDDDLQRESSYAKLLPRIIAGIRGTGDESFEWARSCLVEMATALDDIVRQERQGWESGNSMPTARLHFMFSEWWLRQHEISDDDGCRDNGLCHLALGNLYARQAKCERKAGDQ